MKKNAFWDKGGTWIANWKVCGNINADEIVDKNSVKRNNCHTYLQSQTHYIENNVYRRAYSLKTTFFKVLELTLGISQNLNSSTKNYCMVMPPYHVMNESINRTVATYKKNQGLKYLSSDKSVRSVESDMSVRLLFTNETDRHILLTELYI